MFGVVLICLHMFCYSPKIRFFFQFCFKQSFQGILLKMGAIEQCMYLLINPAYSVLAQQRCLKTFLPLGSKIVKVYSHVSWISARNLSKISNFNLIHTVCLRPKVLVFLLLLHIQGWALLCPPTSWWRCAVPSADQLFDLLPTRFPPQFGPRGQDLCTEYIMFGSDSGDKHVAASQFSISNAYIIFHSLSFNESMNQ